MPLFIIILLYTISTLLFAIYSKWQFVDDAGGVSGKWHPWGAWMRFIACLTPFITSLFPMQWQNWLLATVIQLPVWDLGINIIALHVKALYLGTSAKTDQLKAKKWLLYLIALIAAILVKIFFKFSNDDLLNLIHRI